MYPPTLAVILAFLVLALLASRAPAQITFTPVPAFTDVDYTYDGVPSHPAQRFNLFLPQGTPPPTGWPVLMSFTNSGFISTDRFASIGPGGAITDALGFVESSGFYYTCLLNGIAIISASGTVSAGGPTANQPPAAFNGGQPGNGVFLPPGFTAAATSEPYEDLLRPMAEKDVIMLVQYLREHAAELSIDPDRIIPEGTSGGGAVLTWIVLGPDRAGTLQDSSQGNRSTRTRHALLRNAPVDWEIFSPALKGTHVPNMAQGTPFDFPCAQLGQTFPSILSALSATAYDTHADGTFALNDALHLYLFQEGIANGADVTAPYTPGTETDFHSGLSGLIWKTRHPANTWLAVRPQNATGLEDEVIADVVLSPEGAASAFGWLVEVLDACARDLGYGGPGAVTLSLCGKYLQPAAPRTLALAGAPPAAPAFLFVGTATTPVPFKGGTLAAFPIVTLLALATDASGALALPVPAGPGLLVLTLQAVVPDASQPKGFALSNALEAPY